jgi:putative SOS response-associated peptidase YedK
VRISPIDAGIRSDLDAARELVRPLPDGLLDVYALSTEMNSSRVEGIELLTPLHG